MTIARVAAERREVRRELTERSRRLLARHRCGEPIDPAHCVLVRVLGQGGGQAGAPA